ncbi:hypothetical protein ABBQ32_012947 [Trebouxia sp. C0010 RCD-2024]
MTTSLNEVISHLQSVVNVLKAAEDIDLTNEDLAWELLSTIEECGSSASMTEDRVENLLQIQRSIAQTLEAYGKLYDRQSEQLQKLQDDVTRVHNLVYAMYCRLNVCFTSEHHSYDKPRSCPLFFMNERCKHMFL